MGKAEKGRAAETQPGLQQRAEGRAYANEMQSWRPSVSVLGEFGSLLSSSFRIRELANLRH